MTQRAAVYFLCSTVCKGLLLFHHQRDKKEQRFYLLHCYFSTLVLPRTVCFLFLITVYKKLNHGMRFRILVYFPSKKPLH